MATPAQPDSHSLKKELIAKLKEGVDMWNAWRAQHPETRPDLSGTNIKYETGVKDDLRKIDFSRTDLSNCSLFQLDLREADLAEATLTNSNLTSSNLSAANLFRCDLTGASLHTTDLSDANLSQVTLTEVKIFRTNLGGADLTNAHLANCYLEEVNLRGAKLKNANLEGATFDRTDLHEANLREANLRNSDLTKAKTSGLRLPDADLNGAKLPDALQKLYDKLGSVSEISDSAKKLFLALLAACLYSWLTIATTKDVDLITNRASSPLPIIQTVIPIVGFYIVAPIILLCIYFYFHFYLQKLWEELAQLPAIFPDGKPLYQRADPWLFNDLVRAHFTRLKKDRPFLSYLQQWISILLAWGLVPITLLLFWGRYLVRRDKIWSSILGILLLISIVFGFQLYRLARNTMRGINRDTFAWRGRRLRYSGLLIASAGLLSMVAFVGSTLLIEFPYFTEPSKPNQISDRTSRATLWLTTLLTPNFIDTDASVKPPSWTGKKEEELDSVKGANLTGKDLRHLRAQRAFLANAQLVLSILDYADLRDADLRQANLSRAHMKHVNLTQTNLRSSILWEADLTDSLLMGTDLTNADLDDANLTNIRVGFSAPTPPGSSSAVDVKYASFRGTKGINELIKLGRHWDMAFYDKEVLQLLGLPPDHNEAVEAYRDSKSQDPFDDAWIQKWRAVKPKTESKPE